MSKKRSRAYVLVKIVPGMEQEFTNEIVSAEFLFDPKIRKMDFVHGNFDFIVLLNGSTEDIERKILEIRKLQYVRRTETLIPFEVLNSEVIAAARGESQPLPTKPSEGKTIEEKGTRVKKVLIVFSSRTGNTEKMAVAIGEGAKTVENIQVELKRFVKAENLPNFDAILVGAPTYHEDIPVELKKLFEDTSAKKINLKGKIGAAFGSYGWDGKAVENSLEIMKYKFEMKTDEPPLLVKETPDQEALKLCRDFGKRVAEKVLELEDR